jgi:hypothetical protein
MKKDKKSVKEEQAKKAVEDFFKASLPGVVVKSKK